jgi:hypothetical protein
MATSSISQLIVDSLVSLVDAEEDSLLNRLRGPLPALAKCPPPARTIVEELDSAHRARDAELRSFLATHAMSAPPHRTPEHDPMFDLLSSRFLLLKVAEAQDLLRLRYQHVLSTIIKHPDGIAFNKACDLVQRHLGHIESDYVRLETELKGMGLDPERPS